jgi:hypothetical protein
MTEMTGEAQALLTGLKEEAGLYTRILSLSAEELQLVKEAELEKATAALSLKQRQLDQIGEIENRLRPAKERWQDIKAGLPPASVQSFQAVLRELSVLLERLIAIERETEDTLSKQIAIVRKGIPVAAAEERARRIYGAQKEGKRKD